MPTQEDVEAWFEAAQEMGLRTIICLLECRKLEKWYGRLHPKGLLGWYKDEGFAVFHFPAEDRQPVPDDVKECSLRAFKRASKPVVLQDSGGADRTGTVAAYIIQQLSL